MRRDMDLVRAILTTAEDATEPVPDSVIVILADGDRVKALHHVEILEGYGLIRADVRRVSGPTLATFSVRGLTWEGYDYLDSIRSETVWSAAKETIADTIKDAPLSVVKDVCTALALHMVKEKLGIS